LWLLSSAPALARCPPGVGKNADGSCMSAAQNQAAIIARARADCLIQAQLGATWCPIIVPSLDYNYPKFHSTYDFRRGIYSAPGGSAR
jgi:hypothetical protein